MDIQKIQSRVSALDAEFIDNGYNRPECELHIGVDKFAVRIKAYRPSGSYSDYLFKYFTGESAEKALQEAEAYKIPNVQDAMKQDFIESLGKLIDKGREIGIDVDFINPLENSMRQLSENILEHSAVQS